jgi:hypothetical protein
MGRDYTASVGEGTVHGITVMSLMALGATYVASPEMQQLTQDMREAMRRAGWDKKQIGRAVGCSWQRVSEQLLDKEPFTLLVRFKKVPAVWREFSLIQAMREGSIVVLPEGYAATVYRLNDVTMTMAKASLPPSNEQKEKTA